MNQDTQPGAPRPATFTVKVCSKDGRLLNEYCLSDSDKDVRTLAAAERQAVSNLSESCSEQLLIVVSQKTLTKFRQVQFLVTPATAD